MLAIDIGQSGSRAWVEGNVSVFNRGKLSNEPIEETVQEVLALLPKVKSDVVSLSLTGLYGLVGEVGEFLRTCSKTVGATKVLVLDDGLASYFGAMRGRSGVALTLGGGIVAVGGNGEKVSHTDGLGNVFGDEGSGYWLGTRAIARALAAKENREDDPQYLEYFMPEVNAYFALEVKNSKDASLLAIGTGKKVLEAADAGFAIAQSIRDEGAMRLSKTVLGAWLGAGGTRSDSPLITITGGLSKNASYKALIMSYIHREIPKAELVEAAGDNLDGALWAAENVKNDLPPLMKWAHMA